MKFQLRCLLLVVVVSFCIGNLQSSDVAMRTDWSKRWPDAAKMENKDAKGTAHYPGWSLPALKFLYEDRKITASGHETTDTDPGIATTKDDYSLETYILSTNHYQIELLTNLTSIKRPNPERWWS